MHKKHYSTGGCFTHVDIRPNIDFTSRGPQEYVYLGTDQGIFFIVLFGGE